MFSVMWIAFLIAGAFAVSPFLGLVCLCYVIFRGLGEIS